MNEWLQLTDLSDNDDDLDIDVDEYLIPTVQERDAAAEPACDSDLTQFQAEVLRREDDANDRALRDITTDDCYTSLGVTTGRLFWDDVKHSRVHRGRLFW